MRMHCARLPRLVRRAALVLAVVGLALGPLAAGPVAAQDDAGSAPTPPPALSYTDFQGPGWLSSLEVPVGFKVEEVATGLVGPRFMALDQDGSLLVASFQAGGVFRLRDTQHTGHFDQVQTVAMGLTMADSVLFVNGQLLVAAEDGVYQLSDFGPDGQAQQVQMLISLPTGGPDPGAHRTRTLVLGPDGELYISVGSSCDLCEDDDPLRATVLQADPDGSNLQVFATGLRNTVGMAFRPEAPTPELWGNDMGRNGLGPDLPPDELNLVQQGLDYGFPYCYGDQVPNPEYGDADACAATQAPQMDYPAHWSPLGILFYEGATFPSAYQGDALVAFHGSGIDQTGDVRAGYRVSRVHFENGAPVWMQDFLRGWAVGAGAWGRPAGLLLDNDGSVLVSDDYSGRIYRVSYTG